MISFENTEVFNFDGAIRGMRNPLNSWDVSDSVYCNTDDCYMVSNGYTPGRECFKNGDFDGDFYCIGKKDLKLMKKLINAGSDHRKFMRQIFVCVDITAPLYWWKEFDTYKVGTVSNSCSTMHKIHSQKITEEDFSIDEGMLGYFVDTIIECERLREKYIETKDKKYWRALIQLLPSSYNQRRTITLTYENIYNMRNARRNHKLDEWRVGFMDWSDYLPYAAELFD